MFHPRPLSSQRKRIFRVDSDDEGSICKKSRKTFEHELKIKKVTGKNIPASGAFFSSSSPVKKKVQWINDDDKKPFSKKSWDISTHKTIIKKSIEKSELVKPPLCFSSSSFNDLVQQKKKEFRKVLERQIATQGPFRFYSQLFYVLSLQLSIFDRTNSKHTLLTQLSWLTLSQQLIALIPNENQKDKDRENFNQISNIKTGLLNKYEKILKIIRRQKRAEAYPIYDPSDLQQDVLEDFLIKEIIDYYYGVKVFKHHDVAQSFLESASQVINHSDSRVMQTYSQNITAEVFCEHSHLFFEKIKQTIQSTHKVNESLFYARLLRELIKFHVSPENAHWKNSIFLTGNEVNLYQEYLKILTFAENFTKQSNEKDELLKSEILNLKSHLLKQSSLNLATARSSTGYFFQLTQSPSLMEVLVKILQEHFQSLLKYKQLHINPNQIYEPLVAFIETHCKRNGNYLHKKFRLSRPPDNATLIKPKLSP